MSKQSTKNSQPIDTRRVDAFIDCIARLLAKRWLRDQRQQEEPQQPRESSDNNSKRLDEISRFTTIL